MLNCKQLVEHSTEIIDNEELSLLERVNYRFHLFICRHCRHFLNQATTTALVAKKLELEPPPQQVIEDIVSKMKNFSGNEQQ